MPIADELEKLQQLLRNGTINQEEFEQAKKAVLTGTSGPAETQRPIQVVVQNPSPQGSGGCGCGVLFALLVVAGIIAATTKPDEAAMKKAIVAKHGIGFGIGAAVGELAGTAKYTYHDYIFFSTMTMQGILGGEKTIAYGVFGQVIVPDL
jgi:hypothetical protein